MYSKKGFENIFELSIFTANTGPENQEFDAVVLQLDFTHSLHIRNDYVLNSCSIL